MTHRNPVSLFFAIIIAMLASIGTANAQSANDYRYNQQQTVHSQQQYVGTPHQVWCGPQQTNCTPMGPSANPGARTQYSGNDQTSGTPPQLVVDPGVQSGLIPVDRNASQQRFHNFMTNHPRVQHAWREERREWRQRNGGNGGPVAYPGTTTMQPMYGNNQMQQGMAMQAQPMRVRGQRQR